MRFSFWAAIGLTMGAVVAQPATSQTAAEQMQDITNQWCAEEGHSDEYCGCFKAEVDEKVRPIAGSDEVLLAWMALHAGGAINPMTMAQILQKASPTDQQAAAMIFTQVPDLGASCAVPNANFQSAESIDGSPRERFMTVCIAENDEEELCGCMVDQMQSKLSENDFELLVDLRVAEFQGADDPLAVVADDRGLTREEAEEALSANSGLISGMMATNLMSCVGAVPGLQSLPGLPKQ